MCNIIMAALSVLYLSVFIILDQWKKYSINYFMGK